MAYSQRVMSTAQACGKSILLGEHFVVHGTTAMAIPVINVGTRVTVEPANTLQTSTDFDGEQRIPLHQLVASAWQALGLPGEASGSVHVTSDLPVGMGMGSSASLAVALTRALAQTHGTSLSNGALNEVAHTIERVVHGNPSGIDNTVISHEQPVRFRRGQAFDFIEVGAETHFVLASSGVAGSTRDAVAAVGQLMTGQPDHFAQLCARAEEIACNGVAALQSGDHNTLGDLMNQNHGLLQQIGVSNPTLDGLVQAALGNGALGAKLTGAGMGGCVVVLASKETTTSIENALRNAGAPLVLTSRLEAHC